MYVCFFIVMSILGITGGIGSGKSIVAKILEIMRVPIYNADIAAKKISDSSQIVREKLSKRFGTTIYKNNLLDRAMLALLIFNHPKHLAFVNSVIHPEVLHNFFEWRKQHVGKSFIGIETAILFESGFDKWVDVSINVFAPTRVRIQRIQRQERLYKKIILNRINSQLPDKERIRKANYTIINDDKQAILPQIEDLLVILQRC